MRLLHADPGGLIRENDITWLCQHVKNLTAVDIGPRLHVIQEDNPHKIGEELANWSDGLASRSNRAAEIPRPPLNADAASDALFGVTVGRCAACAGQFPDLLPSLPIVIQS